jgi:hypothetical protein
MIELNKKVSLDKVAGITKSTSEAKEGEIVIHIAEDVDIRYRAVK